MEPQGFAKASLYIRNSLYAYQGSMNKEGTGVAPGVGTAFMIAPGYLITAGHNLHIGLKRETPYYDRFMVCHAPSLEQTWESQELRGIPAQLVAAHPYRDIALLHIDKAPSNYSVILEPRPIPLGTEVGSLGFPFGHLKRLVERFQGAHISAYYLHKSVPKPRYFYETDTIMYPGSSGSPGFTQNRGVFGMHINSVDIEWALPGAREDERDKLSEGLPKRLSWSLWIPASDIIELAEQNGAKLQKAK